MKNLFLLILLMMGTLSLSQEKKRGDVNTFAEAKDNYTIPCESNNAVFTDGEMLRYIVYYKLGFIWIKAGEIIFTVDEQPKTYVLRAEGFTYSSYSWLFKVDDFYKTIIDKETLKPLTSVKRLREGGYKLYEKVKYDWSGDTAYITRGKTEEKTETEVMKISDCIHDLLSLPYYLRVHDYSNIDIGEKVPFKVFLNKKIYNLALEYREKMKKSIKEFGSYNTRRYTAETVAGNTFGEEGSLMQAYISDDKNKVPVFMESDVYVGTVKILLKEAENLKYPFVAKISDE